MPPPMTRRLGALVAAEKCDAPAARLCTEAGQLLKPLQRNRAWQSGPYAGNVPARGRNRNCPVRPKSSIPAAA